jgi:hypothetical protein
MHMTDDAGRFTSTNKVIKPSEAPPAPSQSLQIIKQGYLSLHEGKTFHQYNDRWVPPRYLVETSAVTDRPAWLQAARHYRLAFRDIARSTDERTAIFSLVPPGFLFGNTAPCEREAQRRPTSAALLLLAQANSYTFDWTLRTKSAAHVNLFILGGCPVPKLDPKGMVARALAHGALRLTANHEGYRALWEEQIGSTWREKDRSPFTWPVLPDEDARWTVRAAIDALVADAYGLTRDQYRHVLSRFSHASQPDAPERCLAAFDELKSLGADAFAKKNDPYWDIPLNEQLPKPVIDFPGLPQELFADTSNEDQAEPASMGQASDEETEPPPPPRPARKRATSKRSQR